MQRFHAVLVFTRVTQSHEMAHPRSEVLKRVHAVVVVPATVAEREELRKGAHDVCHLALKLVDRLDATFRDA